MSDQPQERPSLKEIEVRHGWDRWKDASFLGIALLLTLLSIGAVTSKAVGTSLPRVWAVTVVDTGTNIEVGR